jgi:hypothetical protein
LIIILRRVQVRADPPYMESYQLCIGLRNWKSDQGPTTDCRAVDE